MRQKKQGKKQASKQNGKKNLPLILAAVVIVCAAAGVVVYNQSSKNNEAPQRNASGVIAEGESLVIPISEVSQTVQFYPFEVDGTPMEVLAVKATDGSIRTAFNTCQSCYTSGRGYYVQEGSNLVCQNCGFQFTPDQVEIQSGGCNPWPIFAENKTVTDETIEIPYEFLKESASIFARWKV